MAYIYSKYIIIYEATQLALAQFKKNKAKTKNLKTFTDWKNKAERCMIKTICDVATQIFLQSWLIYITVKKGQVTRNANT